MARTNESQQNTPHVCTRWYEWAGAGDEGFVYYYDKEKKENIDVKLPFPFVLLGRMSTIGGWHEPSKSRIFANEVKDTTREPFKVKSFKGGQLVEGFYREIKTQIELMGGHFVNTLYLGYKEGGVMKIGALQLKGSGMHAWIEFEKANREALYTKAVKIGGFVDGKNGAVKFRSPVFELVNLSKESDDEAGVLQEKLKAYHAEYFARNVSQQVAAPSTPAKNDPEPTPTPDPAPREKSEPPAKPGQDDSDIPF